MELNSNSIKFSSHAMSHQHGRTAASTNKSKINKPIPGATGNKMIIAINTTVMLVRPPTNGGVFRVVRHLDLMWGVDTPP